MIYTHSALIPISHIIQVCMIKNQKIGLYCWKSSMIKLLHSVIVFFSK